MTDYMTTTMSPYRKVLWTTSAEPVDYPVALDAMEAHARAIRSDGAPEMVWLLEHPPVYTYGSSVKPDDTPAPRRFPVFMAGRGGRYTYHGPGQRVAYVMLDIAARGRDVRAFVSRLECWLVTTLAALGVDAFTRKGRVGVWTKRPGVCPPEQEDKIAAIGVRLKRWVSFHGTSLNINPNLEHFGGIIPCGITDPRHGVTSLEKIGCTAAMPDVDKALRQAFETVFTSDTQDADPLVTTAPNRRLAHPQGH